MRTTPSGAYVNWRQIATESAGRQLRARVLDADHDRALLDVRLRSWHKAWARGLRKGRARRELQFRRHVRQDLREHDGDAAMKQRHADLIRLRHKSYAHNGARPADMTKAEALAEMLVMTISAMDVPGVIALAETSTRPVRAHCVRRIAAHASGWATSPETPLAVGQDEADAAFHIALSLTRIFSNGLMTPA